MDVFNVKVQAATRFCNNKDEKAIEQQEACIRWPPRCMMTSSSLPAHLCSADNAGVPTILVRALCAYQRC